MDIKVVRATLIPLKDDGNQVADTKRHIEVQFNPSTLRVTLSNDIEADSKGGKSKKKAQLVHTGESTLTVELLFDTTVEWKNASGTVASANSDVRLQTGRIAKEFMQPRDPKKTGPQVPTKCLFLWGSFLFRGIVTSYSETLDFFAPEGVPLRSTLALTLKEDSYQFESREAAKINRSLPVLTAGGDTVTAFKATQAAGGDPREWRTVADANALENPRFTVRGGVIVWKV